MKKGFTLMELLVVIVIVGIVTVTTIVLFDRVQNSTEEENLVNIYKDIEYSAKTYLDLNDSWLSTFNENKEVYISLSELQNMNYISNDLVNPITKENIPTSYLVKVYVENVNTTSEYVNTCIINISIDSGNNEIVSCIANSNGESNNCCDY